MIVEKTVDFVYPDDEEDVKESEYREAARKLTRLLTIHLALLLESKNKETAIWGMVYALGVDSLCEGKSLTDKAFDLGITPQALAKSKDMFTDAANLPTNQYSYKK